MEAIFLLGVGFTRDKTTAMVCLTLAVGFSGFAISGEYIPFVGFPGGYLIFSRYLGWANFWGSKFRISIVLRFTKKNIFGDM